MKLALPLILVVMSNMPLRASDQPTFEVLASDPPYSVVLRIEDDGQSAVAQIMQTTAKGDSILASDEDVIAAIAQAVPEPEALALATKYLKRIANQSGGIEKLQKSMNQSATGSPEYFSYLTPLAVRAYAAIGVVVPNRGGSR